MLVQAIESALAQDYEHIEVIVTDNASNDDTGEVVIKYKDDRRFKYFRNEENIGMVRNWQKALHNYSSGDYFVLLSDDDYFISDNYISKAVKLFSEHDDVVMVYSNGYIKNTDTDTVIPLELPFNEIENGKYIFMKRGCVNPQDFTLCNVVFNKKLSLDLNAFSNEYNLSCDSELFLKTCLCGSVGVIKDYVSVYRVHEGNLLKALKTDVNYLINNLDCYYEPYKLAIQLKVLTDNEINEYENRLLFKLMYYILHTSYVYHNKKYNEVEKALCKKDSDLFYRVLKLHRIDIFIYKTKYSLNRMFKRFTNLLNNTES